MPYLSSTTANNTYFTQFVTQPYTTWSEAGMFVTLCGVPLLVRDMPWEHRRHQHFGAYQSIHCVPDDLRAVGYHLYAYGAGTWSMMGMKNFLTGRRFRWRKGSMVSTTMTCCSTA
jgi:hypothetical protein